MNLSMSLSEPSLMGLACSKLGQQTEAVTWFQRALDLNPRLAEAHFMMGEAALRRSRQGRRTG